MNSELFNLPKMRSDAEAIFHAGLKAVEPATAVKKWVKLKNNHLIIGEKTHYNLSEYNNLYIIGAGKASAPMASEMEKILGTAITKGIINVKYGHTTPTQKIELTEAAHPVPDEKGLQGAKKIFNLAQKANKNDLLLCLISGGGSALLPFPESGLTLNDKQETIQVLLSCGATIHEINAIRKHTSSIKGGKLAKIAYPATLVSLILSDVVGDSLDVIASGPTVPDSSTFNDCLNTLNKYQIKNQIPEAVLKHISSGAMGNKQETPECNDFIFDKTDNIIIGSNIEALVAAKQKAEKLGYNTLILSSMIEGETKEVARVHSAIAREIQLTGHPVPIPACILSGGETTVTITGKGKGGRNQEFALAASIEIAGEKNLVVLSGGTDGNDGPTDAAGAIVDSETLKKARALNENPIDHLLNNDSYNFFKKTNELLLTGPTNTNVMDLRIMLIG